MNKTKNLYRIPILIGIISFVLLILLLPLPFIVFNKSFYYAQYEKNHVYEKVGRNNTQAITFGLMTFFRCSDSAVKKINASEDCTVFLKGNYTNNGRDYHFTDAEISHLSDVKNLIRAGISVLFIAFFLFLLSNIFIYVSIKRKLEKTKNFFNVFTKILFQASLVLLILYVILYIAGTNFSGLFDAFHRTFFPQGNYVFPSNSLLITLFPEEFFSAAAGRIFIISFIITIVVLVSSFVMNFVIRRKLT